MVACTLGRQTAGLRRSRSERRDTATGGMAENSHAAHTLTHATTHTRGRLSLFVPASVNATPMPFRRARVLSTAASCCGVRADMSMTCLARRDSWRLHRAHRRDITTDSGIDVDNAIGGMA